MLDTVVALAALLVSAVIAARIFAAIPYVLLKRRMPPRGTVSGLLRSLLIFGFFVAVGLGTAGLIRLGIKP